MRPRKIQADLDDECKLAKIIALYETMPTAAG
jgi:hypothetical protein